MIPIETRFEAIMLRRLKDEAYQLTRYVYSVPCFGVECLSKITVDDFLVSLHLHSLSFLYALT